MAEKPDPRFNDIRESIAHAPQDYKPDSVSDWLLNAITRRDFKGYAETIKRRAAERDKQAVFQQMGGLS